MDLGTVGAAILFFFSLIGATAVGAYALSYAAHCLLVVVEGTAAGLDVVVWPDEPVFDWLLRSLHIVGVGILVLVPAGLVSRLLRHDWLPGHDLLRFILLVMPLFWLSFPVCVLSALLGESRWILLRRRIVRGMLRLAPGTVAFYFSTGVVLGVVAAAWQITLRTQPLMLPVTAALTGAAVLIYSRLLGRLAWLIGRLEELAKPVPQPRQVRTKRKPLRTRRPRGPLRAKSVEDPWAEPEPELEPERPAKPRPTYLPPPLHETPGYGVADDDAPRAEPRPRPRSRFAPSSPYEVEAYQLGPAPADPPPEIDKPPDRPLSEYEKILLEPPTPPYVPARPLITGVWRFPLYAACRDPWLRMSLWSLLLGGMLLAMLSFFDSLRVE